MEKERFGYSLSVLESSINARAHDPGYEQILLDRQLQLAHIERLEHIAIALENLSDVGDVVASKLTFGTVPGEGSYADGLPGAPAPFSPGPLHTEKRYGTAPPSPGAGPVSPLPNLAPVQGAPMPFCDAPGCKEPVVHHGVVDGIGRAVCIIHRAMLKEGGDDA
jgi:hypothetical protein